jgi:hypothetical protein
MNNPETSDLDPSATLGTNVSIASEPANATTL